MRNPLYSGIACLVIFMTAEAASAATNAHHTYTKPTITFSPASFSITYGDTGKICATVTPSRMASKLTWVNSSNAPGVFVITPGVDPSCDGGSGVYLTITSTTSACISAGAVRGVLSGKTVAAAQGTVILPDKISSTFYSAGLCSSDVTYLVHFASNESGTPNFDGLTASENLGYPPPDGCSMTIPREAWGVWTIGTFSFGGSAPANTIDDGNGKCGLPTNCTSHVSQTFTIGACTFPVTPIDITVQSVSGVASVQRSDCIGAHCIGGQ